jgi:hypothetical protein
MDTRTKVSDEAGSGDLGRGEQGPGGVSDQANLKRVQFRDAEEYIANVEKYHGTKLEPDSIEIIQKTAGTWVTIASGPFKHSDMPWLSGNCDLPLFKTSRDTIICAHIAHID